MSGKGDKPRPLSVSYEKYSENFDRIFNKTKKSMADELTEKLKNKTQEQFESEWMDIVEMGLEGPDANEFSLTLEIENCPDCKSPFSSNPNDYCNKHKPIKYDPDKWCHRCQERYPDFPNAWNEAESLHSCPYQRDMYDNKETQCNCCSECYDNCLGDI